MIPPPPSANLASAQAYRRPQPGAITPRPLRVNRKWKREQLNAITYFSSHQRLRQVRHQIIRVLDPDRKPDRRIADADARAQVGGHARVRRRARVAGKRLGAAEAQTPRDNSAATALRNGGRDWFTVFQT